MAVQALEVTQQTEVSHSDTLDGAITIECVDKGSILLDKR